MTDPDKSTLASLALVFKTLKLSSVLIGLAYSALQQLGYRFSQHFVPVLMQKFDYSGRASHLQFDGFVMALIKIQRLTTAFQDRIQFVLSYLQLANMFY